MVVQVNGTGKVAVEPPHPVPRMRR